MKTRIIGDIHGNFESYKNVIHDCEKSIQVGDFGIGFYGDYWHEKVAEFQSQNPGHRFIRGNHDDPVRSKSMPGFISDGRIENDVMFIGGAWSIDQANRIEGISWWRDEELSIGELNAIYDTYVAMKPRILITHDAPIDVTEKMFIETGLAIGGRQAKQTSNRTNTALQAMFDAHQPEQWFFGHWHVSMQYMYGRTMFQCIGELDFVDVEL